MRYQFFPGVQYKSDTGKMILNEYTCSLTLPIQFKNKNAIITGGTFDKLDFTKSESSIRSSLYGITLQLGYLSYFKKEKWKILVVALPKLSNDAVILNRNSYQQGGVIIVTNQRRKNLAYKFGLYYNTEFFGNFFMPLIGLEWNPKERINVFGVFPSSMNIEYKLSKKWYTGLSYYNLTQSYRINKTNNYVRAGDRIWGNIQLKCFLNYYIKPRMMFYAESGYTFYKKYERYDGNKELAYDPIYSLTNDGSFFTIGFSYRIRFDVKSSNL